MHCLLCCTYVCIYDVDRKICVCSPTIEKDVNISIYQAILHGNHNNLLVAGTKAAISFDEAVHVDVGDDNGEVDTNDLGVDDSDDDDDDHNDGDMDVGNILETAAKAAMTTQVVHYGDLAGGDSDGTKLTEEPEVVPRLATATENNRVDAPSSILSESPVTTQRSDTDASEGMEAPKPLTVESVVSTGASMSFELIQSPEKTSVVTEHPPFDTQELTQISEDANDATQSNLPQLSRGKSHKEHAQPASVSVFDSLMLTFGDINRSALQKESMTSTQSFLATRSPTKTVAMPPESEKIALAAGTSDDQRVKRTPPKTRNADGGSHRDTTTTNGATTIVAKSETLDVRTSTASTASQHYTSTLLSERLPPQQQEPPEEFCTFCRQVHICVWGSLCVCIGCV